MWREDWSRGEIAEASAEKLGNAWAQIIISGLILVIIVTVAPEISFGALWSPSDQLGGARTAIVVVLLIPLLLIVWIFARQVTTITAKRTFKPRAVLRVDDIPLCVGGKIQGRVDTVLASAPDADARLRTYRGQLVRWPQRETPSGRIDSSATVRWELTARIALPGRNYEAQFFPPVFDIDENGRVREGSPNLTVLRIAAVLADDNGMGSAVGDYDQGCGAKIRSAITSESSSRFGVSLTRCHGAFVTNRKLRVRIVLGKRIRTRSRSVEPAHQPAPPSANCCPYGTPTYLSSGPIPRRSKITPLNVSLTVR